MTKMMLLAKFQDHVDEYLENEIGEISDMTVLTSALKCANQYNLKLEFYIIKEIIVEMDTLCDDDENSDSFKSLPFNLIKAIFLFDLSKIKYKHNLPTTKQRFDAFTIWLSENEATEEQKEEIVKSFNFEDFTVEELLTSVRKSGLYTVKKIDERVLYLFKEQDGLVKHQKDLLKENDKSIIERDNSIKEKDKQIQEKDKSIIEKDKLLKVKDVCIKNKDMIIKERNLEIVRLRSCKK